MLLLPCLPEGKARKDLLPPVVLEIPLERKASQGIETSVGMLAKDVREVW